jgi:hypothetical protein
MRLQLVSGLLVVAAFGCATSTDPAHLATTFGNGLLTVTLAKSTIDWNEATAAGGGIVAVISNHGPNTYYARLGDGYASIEQSVFYAASGSDGFVERNTGGNNWTEAERGTLIEGPGLVVIRPGQSYTLRGYLAGTKVVGTYRLRIEYQDSINDEGPITRYSDYSGVFTIQ